MNIYSFLVMLPPSLAFSALIAVAAAKLYSN